MYPDARVVRHLAEIAVAPEGARVGAFFDLDGTLVPGFTATAHAGHRIRTREASLGEVLGVVEASVRYRLGRVGFERLVGRAAGYLRGDSLAQLHELGEVLFHRHVEKRVFTEMHDVVRAHRDRGHTVVLSSSALDIHALPVARFLGIDRVICNQFEVDDAGRLTGGIVRPIIWGMGKAEAVARFSLANGMTLEDGYFYADGDEDAALMRVIGHPRPVNPRPGLAAEAQRRGWEVLSIRPPAGGSSSRLRRLGGRR